MQNYRPLPDSLTIKESDIEGLGLFAKEFIPANTRLGISHVASENFQHGYIRTPLGGFVNHAENSNCRNVLEKDFKYLETKVDIQEGEELTLKYTWYQV